MIAIVEPLADAVSCLAWAALAIVAARLVQRAPTSRHAAWALVAACCVVVAVDKTVDLQTAFYALAQRAVGALDPLLGLRARRDLVRVVLVVPALATVVLGGRWLARRNRAWGRAERLAMAGIALVLVYVGLRLLPGMGSVVDSGTDRVLELAALLLIASGAQLAWPGPGSL
jgi:hypothetical protein